MFQKSRTKAATKDAAPILDIGALQADGTIYAGVSPTTHRHMFAAPVDAAGGICKKFNAAVRYARSLKMGGHKDFRLPDFAELRVLQAARNTGAFKGTFDLSGAATSAASPANARSGSYWSTTPAPCNWPGGPQDGVDVVRFSDGAHYIAWSDTCRENARAIREGGNADEEARTQAAERQQTKADRLSALREQAKAKPKL